MIRFNAGQACARRIVFAALTSVVCSFVLGQDTEIRFSLVEDAAAMPPQLFAAANPADSKSIKTFINCVNDALIQAKGPVSVADTVKPCIPPRGCFITVTRSDSSAQKACTLAGVDLPRVLLNCPGPAADLRFRPSYLLCPLSSNRIEIGEDQTKIDVTKPEEGQMIMADVPIRPGNFQKIDPNAVFSFVDSKGGTKNCNKSGCHIDTNNPKTPAGTLQFSGPIDPFGKFNGVIDLATLITFTTEPGKKANPEIAEDLKTVCKNINAKKAEILAAARKKSSSVSEATVDAVEGLCKELSNLK